MQRFILLSLFFALALQASSGVMKSGQNKCYNLTEEIPCPQEGEPFYGQDASYQSGKPIHFIKDSDQKIIKDVTNNLTWQLNTDTTKHLSMVKAIRYCQTLELAGITDWRLPEINEMLNWNDYSVSSGLPIHAYFDENTKNEEYISWWSTSEKVADTDRSWTFYKGTSSFLVAGPSDDKKVMSHYARCVSGDKSTQEEEIVVYDDADLVYDKKHGLLWQDSSDIITMRTWQEALAYCESSTFEGFDDWRLPGITQLRTLRSFDSSADVADSFTHKENRSLWSSTTTTDHSVAFTLNFLSPDEFATFSLNKMSKAQVRCVREVPIADYEERFNEEVVHDVSDYNSSANKVLSLQAGWNLVALPVDINISRSEYAHYFNGYEQIYTFSQEGGWLKDPQMIHAGEGFWIKMSAAGSYTFSGESYSIVEKISALPDGWHLLGTGRSSVIAGFSDIDDDVWRYQEEHWDNNPGSIGENSGFWIHKRAGTVQVIEISSTSTPLPELNAVDEALMLTETDCREIDEMHFACSNQDLAEIENYQDKPFFVDALFKGVIDAVEADGAAVRISLRLADTIEDVYKDFNITLNADEVLSGLNQAAPQLHGKYDHINSAPLRYSFRRGDTTEDDEIILRIDFPEGYYIPIRKSSFNCDLMDTSCQGYISVSQSNHADLGATEERYGLTVSTEGSYVEVGVGAYISAKYDHNLVDPDSYRFELQNSAYFKSNIKFTISGELEKEWKTNIKISNMINVEIVHPYSAAVKLEVGFQPMVEIGAAGTLEAELVAHSSTLRTGKMGFKYSSREGELKPNSSIVYSAFNEDGVEYEAKVEAHAFLIPRIALRPKLKFLRVSQALSFGEVRGGIKIDAGLTGEVKTDFTITNEGFNTNIDDAQAELNLGVSALVDYILEIRLGKEVFYAMDDFDTLYESSKYLIFDWKLSLLPDPKLTLINRGDTLNTFEVSTNVEENADKIKYYYTLTEEGSADYNGSLLDFRSNAQLLHGYHLSVEGNKKLNIQGELRNSAVSSSIWSFGTSLSKVISIDINESTLDNLVDEGGVEDENGSEDDNGSNGNGGSGTGDGSGDNGGSGGGTDPDYTGCDIWAIRFANHQGFDCSAFTDPSDVNDCEVYNECVDSIVCVTAEQAQLELDTCTLNYVN